MNGATRIYLSRVVEKIDSNKSFAEKIGIKNTSKMNEKKDKNQEEKIC